MTLPIQLLIGVGIAIVVALYLRRRGKKKNVVFPLLRTDHKTFPGGAREYPGGKMARTRDYLACKMCNVIMRTLATKWYRDMVRASVQLSLSQALAAEAKDEK